MHMQHTSHVTKLCGYSWNEKNINHLIQTIYTVMESPPCTNGITYSICYTSHVMLSCLWYYHCRLIGEI